MFRTFLKFAVSLLSIFCIAVGVLAVAARYFDPRELGFLATIGLLFLPIMLVVLIGLTVSLLTKSKKWSVLFGSILILALPQFADIFELSSNSTDLGGIKLMTHNVQLFGFYNWTDNTAIRDRMFKELKTENADILCFQEFFFEPDDTLFMTKRLIHQWSNTPFEHEGYTQHTIHDQHFGLITFSRHPIIHRGQIVFDSTSTNTCIYSDILLPSHDTLRVMNAHLASIHFTADEYAVINGTGTTGPNKLEIIEFIIEKLDKAYSDRANQVDRLIDEIKKSPHPIILAGDLNDTPHSNAYFRLCKLLEDAHESKGNGLGNTWNGSIPILRIDHVLHSEEVDVLSYRIPEESDSDHLPVIVNFQIADE